MLLQRFPYPAYIQPSSAFHGVGAVSVFIGFGFLMFILILMNRVVGEKAKGSKELLKMMGMTDNLYWTSTFLNYFGLAALDLLIIIIIYKCPLKKSLIFMAHTNGFLLLILLLLFGATLVLFCLAFSTFFNRVTIAVIAILLAYEVPLALLSSYYFSHDTTNYSLMPKISKLGLCLLPPGALLTMFLIITFYESTGEGARWSNITEYGAVHDMNMLTVIEMMVISCFIYTVIIWYVDAVWPWQFGIPKPLNFPFTKNYWCNGKPKDTDELELVERELNSEFFEDEPSGVSPGIVTCNISKEFRTGFQKKLVVKNVSLVMYRGQITALLGHNGAGKTTFINILTGLCTPSSGSASINGFNILTQTSKARSSLGVCPQHNILYDDLTVEEHLKIFAALKGIRWSDISDEISHVLNVLYLTEKRNELAKTLSGGMKRKLCLGIAIIGGSKVLFLDEPTSGMDVEARRNVWDALLDLRHDRTIILTTHYMEEADILGDRVAIMAEGEIQCCGSPMFLKKKFGTGYHLHLVKNENFDLNKVTELLEKHKPQSVIEMNTENEVTFNLSTGTDSSYGNLFKDLEDHKVEFGVDSFGVTVTTMDDVFLNVANISDLKLKLQANNSIQNETALEVEDLYDEAKKAQPSPKFGVQLFGLLTKRFHYAKRNLLILISQILLPFLIMMFCFYIISLGSGQTVESFPALKLDIQSVYGQTIGFYQTNEDQITAELKNIFEENSVSAKEIDDPSKFILEYSSTDFSVYSNKLLVGVTVEKLNNGTFMLTAWYNGEPYHVAPMSLLLLHTALLRFIIDSGSITLINAPLPSGQQYSYDELRMHERLMANIFVPLALTYISAAFVFLPTHERTSKAKLLQLMTGISAPLYWASMFLWDFLVLFVACLVLIIPFAMFTPYAFFFSHSEAIGTSILMILLYGWASIPFSYLFSFLCKKGTTGYSILEAIAILSGSFAAAVLSSIQLLSHDTPTVDLLIWIFRILPPFCVSSGFSKLFAIAYNNAFCESISKNDLDFSCSSDSMTENSSLFKCCKDLCGKNCLQQTDLITWDVRACGRDILMLYVDGIVFSLIVCFLETVTARKFMVYIKQHLPRRKKIIQDQEALSNVPKDSDVIAEEERIRNMHSDAAANEALVVSDLTKMFKALCAVDHLTFSIHQEECFGLLGVNGAGKTTTFRMLTGDCIPSDGNAFVKEYSLKENLEEFQFFIGYCPQFDALIDRLTGRETLELFAYLRGLSGQDIVEAVNMVIKLTDLSEHADKQTQFYSGGTKRKLSIGIALIGSPPLIFLDEPTAGVDPVSRRKIWAALSQVRTKTGAAVILTTHRVCCSIILLILL
ncbi:ATP-binding cassette sub-family A member 3-like isoform X2 [Stegodyphus dumicola]|uniref:ATP-binding cassette sub-family A member 3-like isoform X2 n=1 Tax=Stegodyphus dumicola TaxID=202533 RepID=UPI0015A8C5DD|nr:ATP-binding cassette sub-family A member 3-like isoform X2 [Stegodyphus dumicola]